MSDRLEGLRGEERAACLIAERVLGAVATPWAVGGRRGAVDAMLALPGGQRAAFEVTVLAASDAMQLEALLGRDDFRWPAPAQWWWTVRLGSPRDLPRLKRTYSRIAVLCEAAGVVRPDQLSRRDRNADPDVRWLVQESDSDMFGHPGGPARDGKVRDTMIVPTGRGGSVDHALIGLHQALTEVFAQPQMPRHVAKLAQADADERHLFVPVDSSAFSFAVGGRLCMGTDPPEPPALPTDVTHLWLAPRFARRVLLWTPGGWDQHDPTTCKAMSRVEPRRSGPAASTHDRVHPSTYQPDGLIFDQPRLESRP